MSITDVLRVVAHVLDHYTGREREAIGKLRFTNEPIPTAAMWWLVPPSAMTNRSPCELLTYRARTT